MIDTADWSKDTYQASVASRCWWYTPYDDGWDGAARHGADLPADDELRRIVAAERALGELPQWAVQMVERVIRTLVPCGHYTFPRPYLEAVAALGSETPPAFVHGCYTVDRRRKREMMDYVFCLDAWLAGARPEAAAAELGELGFRRIDWAAVCVELWGVLGEHDERKDLLVERLIHSQRWKVKERIWDDDLASELGRDRYVGDITHEGEARNPGRIWSHVEPDAPGFDEGSSPRVQRLEARLAELCDDWKDLAYHIRYGWLCAPKALRYLERLIWWVGKGRRPGAGDDVGGFLRCEDTWPDAAEAHSWWRAFLAALRGWWQGRPEQGDDVAGEVNRLLGEASPMKQWLVRLMVRKLEMLEQFSGSLHKLVNVRPDARRGSGPIRTS